MSKKTESIHDYNVVFSEENDGTYSAWVPELPGCASQGETFEETLANVKEAIELYLEDDAQQDEPLTFRRQFVLPVKIYA